MMHKCPQVMLIYAVTTACVGTATLANAQELLPNLRALPPWNISIAVNPDTGNPELRFAATSWNSGSGPLELVPGPVGQAGQEVYQRVYSQAGGYQDHLAGTFVFHPEHDHFHFQEYAVYTLRPVSAPGASQRESYKTSFCVMDTTKVDARLPAAPKQPRYQTCNAIVQGMSVGWGDTYGSHLAGQAIDLTGNTDGLYELTTSFDPGGHILETNNGDNAACILLRISVTGRAVESAGACGTTGNAATISSLEPNSARVGTVNDVIIKGANFTPGIAVGFENGSGPAPTVTNATVLDSSTISATVSVKSGGTRGDRVWDLRVGAAVLADAFEVLR